MTDEAFDALLYDEIIDVCTWARENDYPRAYDWIMDAYARHQNDEQALPVTASQTDSEPHAPSLAPTAQQGADGTS